MANPRNVNRRNRANAQHSTSPVTEAGKARSSQDATDQGMYSKNARLPEEDENDYLALQAQLNADLKPEGAGQPIWVRSNHIDRSAGQALPPHWGRHR